jgi:UDP-N-acetylmuramate dehydrogenase
MYFYGTTLHANNASTSYTKYMQIAEKVSLKEYSSMRLGGSARYLAEITTKNELVEAIKWARTKQLPYIMIGEGSNIIWNDGGYPGLVMISKIMGFTHKKLDETSALFTIGAGEDWDKVVEQTVKLGYSGIEKLSFIPGTAGATPVQNVGAYGCEIKDVLVSLEAYDTRKSAFVTIANEDCDFGYRTSRFKTTDKERFFITSINLKLTTRSPKPPFYPALRSYFEEHDITSYTPNLVREAVIAIRTSKLPDPSGVANNGSFFANPIIPQDQFEELQTEHPTIAHWSMPRNKVKVSAAWLVEHAGFSKDFHDPETGMATWKHHALVLVNEHAKGTADLLAFKKKIVDAVHARFGITLEQEPELI